MARLHILGAPVDSYDSARLVERVCAAVDERSRLEVLYLNVHGVNLYADDPEFRAAIDEAQVVLCDSRGLQLGFVLQGGPVPDALTSSPGLYGFLGPFAQRRTKVFFLGSKPGVAAAAAERLQRDEPGLWVVGTRHGYFEPGGAEEAALIAEINASGADVLFVGLGMPLQERWLRRHREVLTPPVRIAVGAAWEWLSGRRRLAPELVRRAGFEWLWRWVQQPGRLAKRYGYGNPRFLLRLARARGATRRRP